MGRINRKFASGIFFTGISIVYFLLTMGCEEDTYTKKKYWSDTNNVVDIDGNIYRTVKIGNQWWMAENIRTSRYRNGDTILFPVIITSFDSVCDTAVWRNIKIGAYSKNFSVKNYVSIYGFVYNWYAVADIRNIAPEGWHVASERDWKELEMYLGMDSAEVNKGSWRGVNEGNMLRKEKKWGDVIGDEIDDYAIWPTNESGFSACPGQCRLFDGNWSNEADNGYWWTSSPYEGQAWYRNLDIYHAGVFRFYTSKNYGFSVRCVKD